MKLCCLMVLLQVVPSIPPNQREISPGPDAVVQSLYSQIVTRRPIGVPDGEDRAALWPFLSKGLIRRFDTALACEADYAQQNAGYDPYRDDPTRSLPPSIPKPPFGWLESGLFSGENEMALPTAVVVQRTEPQKDSTFRVYVQFTYIDPSEMYGKQPAYHWNGAAIVKREDRRFVIDDILLFKENSTKIKSQLSRKFRGCNGPNWVGYGKVRSSREKKSPSVSKHRPLTK